MISELTNSTTRSHSFPIWFWIAAVLGLAWNIFGVIQFIGSLSATPESLAAVGLTPEQAMVMLGYPGWMTFAFAVGVFGGLLGCVLLLLKKSLSVPVFLISLIGYVALYVGDITEGVFAAIGTSQVVILSIVVIIAVFLLWLSRHFAQKGVLV